jgi:GMP synthase-like glutamine amidotransferase
LKQRRVRLIGVCFGHQIIGRTMGVKVDRSDKGWETSVVAVDLTKRGQEIFGRSSLVREPFDSCTDTVLTGSGDTSNASGYRLRISTRS